MKFSVPVTCLGCNEQFTLEIQGGNLPRYAECPKCHARPYNMWPLGNVATLLLMERVKQELANDDSTVAIILSAMAVEAEMSYLFFKWKGIGSGKLPIQLGNEDKDSWEKEWDEMRSVGNRLDGLSRLLTGIDFDKLAQQKKMQPSDLKGFNPTTSIKRFFQEELFKRRNQIVHYGHLDFEKADAHQCLSLALALIRLLDAMDKLRIKRMDDAHEKERRQTTN